MERPWIQRGLQAHLKNLGEAFPCLLLTGPRQAGKSSLLTRVWSSLPVLRLDDLLTLRLATEDPRGFLDQIGEPVILDEVQMAGSLLLDLKLRIDAAPHVTGRYFLTGSQVFGLMKGVSDSLAGRAVILELLPLSWKELQDAKGEAGTLPEIKQVWRQMLRGFFPGAQHLTDEQAWAWTSSYLMSVVERDIRVLLAITDLSRFQKFLELLALRCAQVLNLTDVCKEAGISHATARDWLSVLEATYVVKLIQPWYPNLSKRVTKAPKILFTDTGILCYLLRIRTIEELGRHSLYGHIFENMVFMEAIKRLQARGLPRSVYYHRQDGGPEVDIVVETSSGCWAYEIKAGSTPDADDRRHLVTLKEPLKIECAQVLCLAPDTPLGQGIMARHFLNMELPE